MWYYINMSERKCVYTGLPADSMDKVVPKEGGDESHNWANSVPCSKAYKEIKKRRNPDDLEMNANTIFKKLELARLEVVKLERDLIENQKKICKKYKIHNADFKRKASKKEQIEMAYKEKEIQEMDFSEVLEENKQKLEW